mmetsp:Transcript_133545/g.297893  ORF Transcript_133545/g.297893 Transcript_133545/m.297893 type:complete len:284 (+) Transcript_133545:247-1098(+)
MPEVEPVQPCEALPPLDNSDLGAQEAQLDCGPEAAGACAHHHGVQAGRPRLRFGAWRCGVLGPGAPCVQLLPELLRLPMASEQDPDGLIGVAAPWCPRWATGCGALQRGRRIRVAAGSVGRKHGPAEQLRKGREYHLQVLGSAEELKEGLWRHFAGCPIWDLGLLPIVPETQGSPKRLQRRPQRRRSGAAGGRMRHLWSNSSSRSRWRSSKGLRDFCRTGTKLLRSGTNATALGGCGSARGAGRGRTSLRNRCPRGTAGGSRRHRVGSRPVAAAARGDNDIGA